MKRREFITLIGGVAAWPLAAHAQQRTLRVGILSPNPRTAVFWAAFDQRMRELGHVEGQNLIVDFVNTGDRTDHFGQVALELVARRADIIVDGTGDVPGLKAVLAASATVPIVMIAVSYDPVEHGFVASLPRPAGNVTGVYFRRPELVPKQMEILRQAFPDRIRVGVLWDALTTDMFSTAERLAPSLQVDLRSTKLERPPYDFVTAFRTQAQAGVQMLLVLSSVYFNRDRPHIAALALQHGLPTMFVSRTYADAGGLMSFGPSIAWMFSRAAEYVDRIAKGAKPADLPVEQPTKFELVINLKTAKALGIGMPPWLLARADEVIE